MTIQQTKHGTDLTIALEGRLDTATAPELEAVVKNVGKLTGLVFDFANLEYISSAGLRVLLGAYKDAAGKYAIRIVNANEIVREVFEVTGFDSILGLD